MRRITLIFLCGFIASTILLSAYAAYNLSVVPRRGGNSIYFGRVSSGETVNREVKIRVNSTSGVKYQIRQRLLEPMVNEKGVRIDREALKFYTLRGSNSSGALYQDMPLVLDTMERVLYVSSPVGDSDSFYTVYVIEGSKIKRSGNFFGRILYTLVPLEGGASEREVIVNIQAQVSREFEVSVTTSSRNPRLLKLSSGEKEKEGFIKVTLEGGIGRRYRLIQSLQEPLRNQQGEILPEDILKFRVSVSAGQSSYPSYTSMTARPSEVYLSDNEGSGGDIVIGFVIDESRLGEIPSGDFKGRLFYTIEAEGQPVESFFVDLLLQIEPVFDIEVVSNFGSSIYFRNVKPLSPPPNKEVLIRVKSNLHKPYSVVQRLERPLTSEKGDKIPFRFFKVKGLIEEGNSGNIAFNQFTPVKQGNTVVFSSDSKGSPSEFRVLYSLQVPQDTREGDYFTNLSYSLIQK
ncbi:MAG: hypothetical protein GF375_06425 [Candidatus Omnitrophica bacterium]|nr:hypothetical protein [Candidatus Omnitrophota bacterium]MBD3269610.1 hypothetical protein [Candidatus Omnitrophota bacterium]